MPVPYSAPARGRGERYSPRSRVSPSACLLLVFRPQERRRRNLKRHIRDRMFLPPGLRRQSCQARYLRAGTGVIRGIPVPTSPLSLHDPTALCQVPLSVRRMEDHNSLSRPCVGAMLFTASLRKLLMSCFPDRGGEGRKVWSTVQA
jgi:hypothetical protein